MKNNLLIAGSNELKPMLPTCTVADTGTFFISGGKALSRYRPSRAGQRKATYFTLWFARSGGMVGNDDSDWSSSFFNKIKLLDGAGWIRNFKLLIN
jgi:hypothetical protein